MFSQNLQKLKRIRRQGVSSFFGPQKRLVDRKTGAGFGDTLKGLFSKLLSGIKPMAKSFIANNAPKLIESVSQVGAKALNNALDKATGKTNEGRTQLVNTLSQIGSKKVSEQGTKLLDKLLGNGIDPNKKGRNKQVKEDPIMDLITGRGLAIL